MSAKSKATYTITGNKEDCSPFTRSNKTPRSPDRQSVKTLKVTASTTHNVTPSIAVSREVAPLDNVPIATTIASVAELTPTQGTTNNEIVSVSEGESTLSALGTLIDELILLTHGQKQRHVNQHMKNIIDKISQLQKQAITEVRESAMHPIVQAKRGRTALIDEPMTEEQAQQQNKRSCINSPKTRARTNLIGQFKRPTIVNDVANIERFEGTEKSPLSTQPMKGPDINKAKTNPMDEQWNIVAKKANKKSVKLPKSKPQAILISKSGNLTYAEILRKIKSESTLSGFGNIVTKIRKTQSGEMLLQLSGAVMPTDSQENMRKCLGDQANVKLLTQETLLECKDLDEVTNKEEVLYALQRQLGNSELTIAAIKSLRKSYGDTQTALIKLPVEAARQLLLNKKLKVGWVNCRIREYRQPQRCFKCLDFGHTSKACKNEDRSRLCRRCGEGEHQAKDCNNKPKCLLCLKAGANEIDHFTGSVRCPVYQKAAQQIT
ncbi:uncharacterized protein LOC128921646 [Zeugodacus cucurbitae]|uniref:uncharacterized protein LOC128921646 n=1 Tax=Zeugodacus cucurbitae TaxID=28588 RepID=UPI0023D95358|nr:uncharacterized protein LOC128921646 [Zeugodacus cucurbitae]